jgi:hypothetical protein
MEIHIFWSIDPKIANNTLLESLGIVLSSSSIKYYILWVQSETIFKLESTILLAWLIHIFSFVHPKITIL